MANDNIARATSHIVTLMIFIIYNYAPITLSLLSGRGHHRFYALCMYRIRKGWFFNTSFTTGLKTLPMF